MARLDEEDLSKGTTVQVNISTRHGHLAQETQEKITEKVQKLARFHGRISSIDVTVDLSRSDAPSVEMRVAVDKAESFVSRVTANGGKLIGAVDAVMVKLGEQLKRHKEKKIDQHRNAPTKHEAMPEDDSDGDK